MDEKEFDRIQRLVDRSTAGRWVASVEGRDHTSGSSVILTGVGNGGGPDLEITGATDDDYYFIAAARQDIQLLLDEVKRLRRHTGKR